jgi:Family of unknown function (DUF6452)
MGVDGFEGKVISMLKNLIFCSIIVSFFASCDIKPDTCKDQSAWTVKNFFYKVEIVNGVRTVSDSTLSDVLVKKDALTLINDTSGLQMVGLELMQSVSKTIFDIKINKMPSAKLYAVYKAETIFENYKCGFRTNFFLDSLYTVPRIFDSIIIVNPNITDVYQENCRFYFNNDSAKYR